MSAAQRRKLWSASLDSEHLPGVAAACPSLPWDPKRLDDEATKRGE